MQEVTKTTKNFDYSLVTDNPSKRRLSNRLMIEDRKGQSIEMNIRDAQVLRTYLNSTLG